MNLDITLNTEDYDEVYAQACNAVFRVQEFRQGITWDDELLHTSSEARAISLAVFRAIGIFPNEEAMAEQIRWVEEHGEALRRYLEEPE